MEHDQKKTKQTVALRYEPKKDSAPKIVCKGSGYIAEKILELAKQYNIPVRQDKNLIQILSRLNIDQEIPADLYKAVAEILAFVYRLSTRKQNDQIRKEFPG